MVALNLPLGQCLPPAIQVSPCTIRAAQPDYARLSHNYLGWRTAAYSTSTASSPRQAQDYSSPSLLVTRRSSATSTPETMSSPNHNVATLEERILMINPNA